MSKKRKNILELLFANKKSSTSWYLNSFWAKIGSFCFSIQATYYVVGFLFFSGKTTFGGRKKIPAWKAWKKKPRSDSFWNNFASKKVEQQKRAQPLYWVRWNLRFGSERRTKIESRRKKKLMRTLRWGLLPLDELWKPYDKKRRSTWARRLLVISKIL